MSALLSRIVLMLATVVLASTSFALAATKDTPAKKQVAQASPAATPTPNPFTWRGSLRAYYFTRQNASNYPGVQWNPAKYNSNAVNQASFNTGIDLHADYHFADSGFYVGGGYFYGNPMDGQCVQSQLHAHGQVCVTQVPPNTNPDDTLPGFTMSTIDEAYLGYNLAGFHAVVGNQLLNNPWAGSYDATRLKPAAYQGADFSYTGFQNWTFEAADMIEYENRTSSAFTQSTLLTSYPAGGAGLASNIYVPGCSSYGCKGINTTGFFMGRASYNQPSTSTTNAWGGDGYLYAVSDIDTMWYGDLNYHWSQMAFQPYIAVQGGWQNNAGNSVVGKINSEVIGAQVGASYKTKWGTILGTFGYDYIPWKTDTITPPAGVSCNSTTNTVKVAAGSTLAYFLPNQAPDCIGLSNGQMQVYYGGWASPYTDNYATDPLYTTSISQGMVDRRAPGDSYKVQGQFTSLNNRLVFIASDAWYEYGNNISSTIPIYNATTALSTNEWDLDGRYYFSKNTPGQLYKGLLIRYRYMQRTIPDTYFANGSTWLGGIPLFKYNRAQVEYDF